MPATPELWRDLFQVNNTDSGTGGDDQFDPKVIQLTNGNFVIAWESNTDVGAGATGDNDIIGEIYDALGNLVKSEFRINTASFSTDEGDFDMAALPSGGFVVTYIDNNGSDDTDVRLVEWDADATTANDILVAADGNDSQTYRNPNVEVSSNSQVLITWENVNPDADANTGDVTVQSQNYDSVTNAMTGSVNDIFAGAEGTGEGVSGNNIAALSNGNYAVVYGNNNNAPSDDAINVQLFNADGTEIPGTISVSGGNGFDFNQDPHIVGLTGGGFVVVWEGDGTDFSGNSGVRGRLYDNAGVAQGAAFTPATTLAGDQSNAVVAALDDGGFVIAWIDEGTRDIHGQRYDASASKIGSQFNIDTDIGAGSLAQARDLDIQGLDDGRFVVTWEEAVPTSGLFAVDFDVRAKIYDPRDAENSPNDYTSDEVIGTIGADTIDVVSADDEVYGWNGDDTLSFANGVGHFEDIYDGGSGTDRILLTEAGTNNFGTASIRSIEEIEFQAGAGENKTATFDASEFGGSGISFSALIDGNANGSGAVDTLRINMGDDTNLNLSGLTFSGWQDANDIIEINGDASAEIITGSSRADLINGSGGVDTLNGFGGNDVINGGTGDDMIDGGTNSSGGDTASYEDATGDVSVYLQFTGLDVGGGQGIDTLSNIENLTGGIHNDRLIGDANDNVLTGGDGNDILKGKEGNDTFFGGDGNDTMTGGEGIDIMEGGNGDDIMFALGGNDILNGGADRDFLYGGRDADTLHGDGGDDEVRGNRGDDMIFGDAGIDDLRGGGNDDTLDGGADDDFLFGENGMDTLIGGAGSDSLTGGLGGGAGGDGFQDTFVYSDTGAGAGGFDRIKDMENGTDLIDLTSFGFANFAAVDALASNTGGDMRINFGGGDVLYIENFSTADFDASDVLI